MSSAGDVPYPELLDPVARALSTSHSHFALTAGLARKYPAAVTVFATIAENSAEALQDLLSLLEPGETTYVIGERPPEIAKAHLRPPLPCLQMVFPTDCPLPAPEEPPDSEIVRLTWDDGPAMVALTDIAFPGYFRLRTCEMGQYFGVRQDGRLIAMAGERMCLNPLREVSGVCTHPDYRGRGLATRLMAQVMREQRRNGHRSWLHVVSTNRHAIELYLRMGYQTVREVELHGISPIRATVSSGNYLPRERHRC